MAVKAEVVDGSKVTDANSDELHM